MSKKHEYETVKKKHFAIATLIWLLFWITLIYSWFFAFIAQVNWKNYTKIDSKSFRNYHQLLFNHISSLICTDRKI